MRRLLLAVLLLSSFCYLKGQNITNEIIATQIERMTDRNDEEADYSEEMENYLHILDNKININDTDELSQLSELNIINITTVEKVNEYRKKYGFTETDFRKRGKNSRTAVEKKIMLKGGISWKEELREVIAEATKNSTTPDNFKDYLEKCYGVKITRDGKDYSYLHPEKQKPIRGEKLGTNYTKKEILRKIDEQNNGRISSAHNRGPTGGYFKKSGDIRFTRRSKKINSGSARGNVFASIGDIERAMQRL